MDKNLLQRLLSGVIYVSIIFLCTTTYGSLLLYHLFSVQVRQEYLFFGLMSFFMLMGTWECSKIMKLSNSHWKWFLFPVVLLVYYRFATKFFHQSFHYTFNLSDLLALALVAIASITLFKSPKELQYDNGKFIFTIIYTAIPFGFALAIPKFSMGDRSFSPEVFLLFVLIFSSDSFAYIAGRLWGKHKLAPAISPKKTWEGYIGGVVCTLVLGFFIEKYMPQLWGNWMIVGLLVSVFAPWGDLVESQLKRTFGVKDSGNIIPGHGGILDRLDSFIICVPVVYLYFVMDKLI